ncbi:MAG: hypothetical protein GY946_20380, partial [bacterium]|nr:hypothetical protein [bacterium]
MDWYPTVLELCGVKPAADAPKLDGHSLLPIIDSSDAKSAYGGILHFAWGNRWAVREGEWKLIGTEGKPKATLHRLTDEKPEATNHAKDKPEIVARLIAGGRAASTPSAAIRYGTLPSQQVVVAPLGELVARIEAAGLTAPAVIVVGEVVQLRAEIGSAENQPLFGHRVLLTRPAASAAAWALALRDAGAQPMVVPMIRIESLPTSSEIDAVLGALENFDALLFASANGVRQLAKQMQGRGISPHDLAIPAHCVGPATAAAADALGFAPGELPDARYDGEGLALHLIEEGLVSGRQLLQPQPEKGRRVLAARLREAGAIVRELAIYRTVPEAFDGPAVAASLADGALDALVFASPSAVRSFAAGLGEELCSVHGAEVVALGPATADALREIGFPATLEPASATVDQCIEALAGARKRSQAGARNGPLASARTGELG